MPSSDPSSTDDPAVPEAVVTPPVPSDADPEAVLDTDIDDGEAGGIPGAAALPHPVSASARAARTAVPTR